MIGYETLKNWAARFNDRENNTTNTTVYDQRIAMGWGFITHDASEASTKTITFPFTFEDVPLVFMTVVGETDGSDPTDPTGTFPLTDTIATWVGAKTVTTTNFVAIAKRNPASSGMRSTFAWMAIGTQAI